MIDTNGRAITDADVNRALHICTIAGMFGMIWGSMSIVMPLTMFLEAIGASGVLIGAVTTIRLLGTAVQIPSALMAESSGSRKRFFGVTGLTHRVLWFAVAGLALCWHPGAWWVPLATIAIVGISDILGQGAGVTWYSWMADIVPDETSGRFWGRRLSIVTLAGLCGMGLAGFLMDCFKHPATGKTTPQGFALVFGIAAICGVTDIAFHLIAKEPMPGKHPPHHGLLKRILTPLRSRNFRLLLTSMGIWNFASIMIITFGYVYVKRGFPVTYSQVSALGIAYALGGAATGFVLGSWIDQIGARKVSALLLLLVPFASASWFFIDTSFVSFRIPGNGLWTLPQAIAVLAPTMFVLGAIVSGLQICQFQLLGQFTSVSGRTMSASVFWTAVGWIGGAGSLAGGCLMDLFAAHPIARPLPNGMPFSFFHAILIVATLCACLISLPLLLRIRGEPRKAAQ